MSCRLAYPRDFPLNFYERIGIKEKMHSYDWAARPTTQEEEDDDSDQVEDSGTEEEEDDGDDEDDEGDDYDDDQIEEGDDEALSNKVIRSLKEGSDLDSLNLKECKAYLRRNGLRISGTKSVCIQRIEEHQRFDKVTRHGRILGKRTVAGRVVKESYGAAKQQHTFTRWSNEAERSKVLAEKHRRGEAARRVRAMKKSKKSAANGGVKRQKQSHFTRPNQIRKNNESEKGKHLDRLQKRTSHGSFCQHRAALPSKQLTLQRSAMSKASQCFSRHQNPACFNIDRVPALHSQAVPQIRLQSQLEFQHRSAPFQSFSHAMNSNSTMLRYPVTTNVDTLIAPASQFQRFSNSSYSHNGYVLPGHNLENWDHLPGWDRDDVCTYSIPNLWNKFQLAAFHSKFWLCHHAQAAKPFLVKKMASIKHETSLSGCVADLFGVFSDGGGDGINC
ncbi:SAP domain-containing protein [Prunus dulcis]|uniref:SAP domain-containing protein n=1 Tax=Prunus dulcis TaxID=3755 RepID=A0A4Y1RP68_PRUDU|nr:SAP domain-containing protein [Prunus dulcis]